MPVHSSDVDPSEFGSSDELSAEYDEYLDEFFPPLSDDELDDMASGEYMIIDDKEYEYKELDFEDDILI